MSTKNNWTWLKRLCQHVLLASPIQSSLQVRGHLKASLLDGWNEGSIGCEGRTRSKQRALLLKSGFGFPKDDPRATIQAFSRYPSHKRKAGRGVGESRCIGIEGAGASVEDLICS